MVKPVVVVGAGLAGLVCARRIHRSGIPVLLVDADDRPGGRLKTDKVDGFLLDQGFQVLFTAYPHAQRELDYESLRFGAFRKGAQIFHDGRLALLEPQSLMEMVRNRFEIVRDKTIPLSDKRLLAKLDGSLSGITQRQAFAMEPMATEDFLRDFGFGDETMDRFFRPFLGGVFLDPTLSFDSRQFAFVWSMMSQGRTVLPAEGIQAITDQIASDIPRYLFRMGNRVSEIIRDANGSPCGVRFDTSEVLEAGDVVIATEGDVAARLVGQPTVEGHKSSTCLYFETAAPVVEGPYLVLNGSGQGIVNHVAPVSNVCPTYAPAGKHLVSVCLKPGHDVADGQIESAVLEEMNQWFPSRGAYMWRFIREYRVRFAQMAQPVGFVEHLPGNATNHDGIYWAGEFTENSSIDGAIRSGIECANRLMADREETEAA